MVILCGNYETLHSSIFTLIFHYTFLLPLLHVCRPKPNQNYFCVLTTEIAFTGASENSAVLSSGIVLN